MTMHQSVDLLENLIVLVEVLVDTCDPAGRRAAVSSNVARPTTNGKIPSTCSRSLSLISTSDMVVKDSWQQRPKISSPFEPLRVLGRTGMLGPPFDFHILNGSQSSQIWSRTLSQTEAIVGNASGC